ncbi:MAG: hypothetical protein J6Y08_09765 [Clostridiales bacterium]|nr:hypothetical protein [Clostridiales bacterium]
MTKQQRARQVILYIVYITTVCCVQVTFSRSLHFFGKTPDLMLIFVVLAGYLFGTKDGIAAGVVVGIFRDYFSGPVISGIDKEPVAVLGIGLLAFFYVGLLSSVLFRKKFRRKFSLGILQVGMISLMYYSAGHVISWLYLTLSGNLTEYYSLRYIILDSILPQVVINLIFAVPLLLLLRFAGPYKKGVRSSLVDGYSMEDRKWQSI